MDDAELRALATKRLKARSDFYHYLWVWLGVSILLTVIYLLTNPGGYFWPAWAIGGMGIAAFFQAISVFGPIGGVISDAKIDAEVERLKK
jgi:H+/Cl- antiporter ClcA